MSQNISENQFRPYDERPLTIVLAIVAVTLILDGIVCIVLAGWFHSTGYPIQENVLEPIVQIAIGLSLLLNVVFARFLNLFYCGASFLGAISFFSRPGMKNVIFRNFTVFHIIVFGFCAAVLILDMIKNMKKKVMEDGSSEKLLSFGKSSAPSNFASPEYYGPIFDKFQHNASPLSWNWAAFFFSFLWQMSRGIWLKGLLYAAVFILLEFWAKFLNIPLLDRVVWFGASLFYGLISNYDYYLLKVHRESLWLRFPYRKYKITVWCALGVLLIAIVLSSAGYSRASSFLDSYYSSVESLGKSNYQIMLDKGEKFKLSLPDGWNISRLRSEGPWIAITLPGFDELGLGIYDLPEKLCVGSDEASLSAIVRKHITEQSWLNRLIFNPSDWTCSRQNAQKGQPWRFCGYIGTHDISFQVVFAVLGKQLIMVTHSVRASADEAVFQEKLKLFLSSIHRDSGPTQAAGSN